MKHCKICSVEIQKITRTYCSNKCKFSDKEYNRARVSCIKNDGLKKLTCKHCGWFTLDYNNKSGAITEHLRDSHGLVTRKDSYLSEFALTALSNLDYWRCHICDWRTLDKENKSGCILEHLQKTHKLSLDSIIELDSFKGIGSKKISTVNKYKFLMENEDNRIECKICNQFFRRLSATHLKKHAITPSEYKIKYNIYNTASKCVSNAQSIATTKRNLLVGNPHRKSASNLEMDLSTKLSLLNISYVTPFLFKGSNYDFYIPAINTVVEIDGTAHHKDKLIGLTSQTINSSVNDFNKNVKMKNSEFKFRRIRYDPTTFIFKDLIELESALLKYSYTPEYTLTYRQRIVHRDYFESFILHKGKEKLKSYIGLYLRFLRVFSPEFPYPDLVEDGQLVSDTIRKYDLSTIYNSSENMFSNKISTVGHNYLKHHFKSFWKSRFNGNSSPVEVWKNDKIMSSIIKYRIGCNDSNELFDFSLQEMVRGISAHRLTVSFFKPLLAAAIYRHYLGDVLSPIVFDPCCGFGGRLMGFKSVYPNGKYIGCEPNIETYNELLDMKIKMKWDDVEIFNCKLEDFSSDNYKFDLIFTSIPYYDLEIYSNSMKYGTFDIWRDTFIKKIESFSGKNCYINTSLELAKRLGWIDKVTSNISSNRSHFDKNTEEKLEPIIKM